LEAEVAGYLDKGIHEWSQSYRIRDAEGCWRSVEDRNVVFCDPEGEPRVIDGLVVDVSEKVVAEGRLDAAFAQSPIPMLLLDHAGVIQRINQAVAEMTGYELVAGATVWDAIAAVFDDPEDRERALEALGKRMRGEKFPPRVYHCTNQKTGSQVVMRVHTAPYQGGFIIQLIDLTERHRLEKAVIEAAESERRSFGRDLHDVLGQDLAGLSYTASALAAQAEQCFPEAAKGLEQLGNLLAETMRKTKRLARGMCLVSAENIDIGVAIEELAREAANLYGKDCRATVADPLPVLTSEAVSQLLQIAREAVLNAVRHAKASRIAVSLEADRAGVILSVEDNGVGFTRDAPPGDGQASSGLGLMIMEYRAELLGGQFSIDSLQGRGTIVKCTFRP
jgi:hypothetical protein